MVEIGLILIFSLSLVYTSDSILTYRSFFRYEEGVVEGIIEAVIIFTMILFSLGLLSPFINVVLDVEELLHSSIAYFIKTVFGIVYAIMGLYHYTLYRRYSRIQALYH